MKKLLFIALFVILGYAACHAQTMIPQSTTVYDLGKMPNGFYRIVLPGDTTDIIKDSSFCARPIPVVFTTIFTTQTLPTTSQTDGQSITLGIKFRSSVAGYVKGVRFYKTKNNIGAHIGYLYSSTGTLLASGPFPNESASGWQYVYFAVPVAISANTTYIAAYYSPSGQYSDDNYTFNSAITNGPITALKSGTDGVNGVYNYQNKFPTLTYRNSNYWVDLMWSATR